MSVDHPAILHVSHTLRRLSWEWLGRVTHLSHSAKPSLGIDFGN